MEEALHDVERAADVALHTIIGLKRRISARLDAPDVHLIHEELIELTNLLNPVSQLHTKTLSGTAKQDLAILRAIYRDIRAVLKCFENVREIYPVNEGDRRSDPGLSSSPGPSAEILVRRPIKERINHIARHLRECRLSLLSKLVVLNTVKSIETYPDEDSLGQITGTVYNNQQLPSSSPPVVTELPEDDQHSLDWPEEKSVPHDIDNEKYLSSEMFPVFKHLRQETLRSVPSKHGIPSDIPQSPRSPSMHQLALSEMRYVRSKEKESYFQHLDQAFSKITHSPAVSERGTRPFSVQGQPQYGGSVCNPRCRCRCHSNRSVARLSLSAFASSLGALCFSFTGPNPGTSACTDTSCRARRARWLRITYVFPSWLFQAAITASFTDGIGSPELLIRVCRVLSSRSLDGYYNIFGYISRKDVEKVKEAVLRRHVAVTDVLDTGMTPIGFAIRHFSIPMVQFLLQEGADLFQEGPTGVAPPGFMMALEKIYTDPNVPKSDRSLLEELLPLDMVIEMAGLSPLHKVVLGIRCLDLGELLKLNLCPVDKLDYSGRTALHWAAAKGDIKAIQQLLDAGAQIECKTRMRSESPLMIACRIGASPEAVRVLLAAGADVNTRDSYEQTPLCLTAGAPGNRIEIAAALLDAGTDVNWEEGHAFATPLDFACCTHNVEMVEFLISAGANVSHHDRDGSTPLMNAVVYHACNTASVLLQHGVDVRDIDNEGKTVLHCIAEVSNEDMMAVFATTDPSCSVDPEQRDNNGRTPLDTFDQRTISAPLELREKFVGLLQLFAQRFKDNPGIEEEEVDTEEFFDASEKWDEAHKHGSNR
ncbi:hypothetical protein N8I77_002540 [Diaporthe amygdali]|uniref:Uncharacterized protein n=1 Tax=Phomopsis amygdali TaxID=1214568 RepID=A0AAD9WBW8_PHOAM|nr:hypothetical protein N8I77_002540 [Diaporthe amygdali]